MRTTPRQVVFFNIGSSSERSFTTIPTVRRIASLSSSGASSVAWFRQHKRTLPRHQDSRKCTTYKTFAGLIRPSNNLHLTALPPSDSHNIDLETVSKIQHMEDVKVSDASFDSFHYAPDTWNTDVARRWNATSVSMPFSKLNGPADSLFDDSMLYDLFTIPSLRHIMLYQSTALLNGYHRMHGLSHRRRHLTADLLTVKTPDEVVWDEANAARTSSVEDLTVKGLPRDSYDVVKQLMNWPKALRGFDGMFGVESDPDPLSNMPWDPSQCCPILFAQRASLEELRLDVTHRKKTYGTFGRSLHQFLKLKRLAVPRNFLARLEPDFWIEPAKVKTEKHRYREALFHDVYLSLPPDLEELIVNVDADLERVRWGWEAEIGHTQKWLRDVASHKSELYPSLQKVVLWQSPPLEKGRTIEDIEAWMKKVDHLLGVSSDFEAAGIELSFVEAGSAPHFSGPRSLYHSDVFESDLTISRHGFFDPQLTTAVKCGMLEERLLSPLR